MCRLQYKYMKLVESSSGKDQEMPAAETCALDEGEEDEHFDAVEFKSKGRKFLKRFKKPSGKKVRNNFRRRMTSVAVYSVNIAHIHRRHPRRVCRGRIPTNILVGGTSMGMSPPIFGVAM